MATSSPTSASARGRAARASSGRASTPPARCTCPCSTWWPTTATPSRCRRRTGRRHRSASSWPGFRGLEVRTGSTAPTTSRCGAWRAEMVDAIRAGVGPGVIHADGHAALLATRRPTRRASTARGRRARRRGRATTRSTASRPSSSTPGVLTDDEAAAHPRGGPPRGGRGGRRGARRRRDPTRPRSPTRCGRSPTSAPGRTRPPPTLPATSRPWPWARRSAARCTSRWPPTSASGCSARTWPTPARPVLAEVEGKGGVFGTTARPAARRSARRAASTRPLAEANIIGRARGPGAPGPAPRAPRSSSSTTSGRPCTQIKSEAATIRWRSNGAFTCPMVLRVADRRLPHRRRDLAQPVRRVDLRPRARPAHRLPVARRATPPGCCAPRSGARTRCCSSSTSTCCASPTPPTPSPDAGYVIPFGQGDVRRPGDDLTHRHLGRHRREVRSRRRPGRPSTDGVEVEVIDLRTIAPWDHEHRRRQPVGRTHRLLVVHEDVLTGGLRRRGGGVGRRALLRRPRRARRAGWVRSTPTSPTSPRSSGRSCRRSTTSSAPSPTSAPTEVCAYCGRGRHGGGLAGELDGGLRRQRRGAFGRRGREPHHERRPAPLRRPQAHHATVGLDDLADDGQAEPAAPLGRAASPASPRQKRWNTARLVLGGDAGPWSSTASHTHGPSRPAAHARPSSRRGARRVALASRLASAWRRALRSPMHRTARGRPTTRRRKPAGLGRGLELVGRLVAPAGRRRSARARAPGSRCGRRASRSSTSRLMRSVERSTTSAVWRRSSALASGSARVTSRLVRITASGLRSSWDASWMNGAGWRRPRRGDPSMSSKVSASWRSSSSGPPQVDAARQVGGRDLARHLGDAPDRSRARSRPPASPPRSSTANSTSSAANE